MGVPQFIQDIRSKIGHDQLWLPSVTAVVLRDSTEDSVFAAPEVLLVKRSDNGRWTPVTGICDPGEEPQDAAIREVKEETGLDVEVAALVGVGSTKPAEHVNGDKAVYMFTALLLSVRGSDEARVADDESSEVGWFPVTRMPVEDPTQRMVIADAVAHRRHPERTQPRVGYRRSVRGSDRG